MSMLLYFALLILIPLLAQWGVKSTYRKYADVRNTRGVTGAEVARYILNQNGLYSVQVEEVPGTLTDHYDPRNKTVRLSTDNYYGTSIAGASVAAHEVGHAIQDATNYSPLRVRHALVPVANLGSSLSWIFILIGLILNSFQLTLVGVIFFAAAVLFQIVTLPVEFNASHRALGQLQSLQLLGPNEVSGSKKVLTAAALTYVAATLVAILQLVQFILAFLGQGDE
ncbi:zinc metallopeptidase [Massilibacterium senegalense]|uniref:zinc metallopeptidase n=1 Tax=Massilibacterium senegalense TaxID=1632858 RepID=UPI000AEA09B6|nr:zinc metallopeptidase [Massilibacterium senegalense]